MELIQNRENWKLKVRKREINKFVKKIVDLGFKITGKSKSGSIYLSKGFGKDKIGVRVSDHFVPCRFGTEKEGITKSYYFDFVLFDTDRMGNYYSVCQNELFLELKQELIETEAKEISERMDSILAEMKRIIFRKENNIQFEAPSHSDKYGEVIGKDFLGRYILSKPKRGYHFRECSEHTAATEQNTTFYWEKNQFSCFGVSFKIEVNGTEVYFGQAVYFDRNRKKYCCKIAGFPTFVCNI